MAMCIPASLKGPQLFSFSYFPQWCLDKLYNQGGVGQYGNHFEAHATPIMPLLFFDLT